MSGSFSTIKKPLADNRLSFPASASSPIASMAFLAKAVNDRSAASASASVATVPGVTRKYSRPISSASFYDQRSYFNGNKNGGGFVNLGNTCYMNAVLQALLNLPQFRRDVSLFDPTSYSKDRKKKEFLECLKLLLKEQKDSKSIVRPDAFLQCVRKLTQQFQGGQEDADEFLRTVLDLLSLRDTFGSTEKEEDKENIKSNPSTYEFDLVRSNFEFEIERRVYCLNCEFTSENVSVYRDIPLFLPKHDNEQDNFFDLDTLLKSFFMNYQVDYCCEKCGSMEAMIHQGIKSLPRVLVLELKRFDMIMVKEDPDSGGNRYGSRFEMIKRNDKVLLPSVLDISTLCSKNVVSEKAHITATKNNSTPERDNSILVLNSDGDFVEEEPSPPLKPLQPQSLNSKKYKLKTMISHIGSQPSHGHYVCDVLQQQQQQQGDQKFVCYNDAKVETVGTNGSIDDLNAQRSRSSYILFYSNEECL